MYDLENSNEIKIDIVSNANQNEKHIEFWKTKNRLKIYLESGEVITKTLYDTFELEKPILINEELVKEVEGFWLQNGLKILHKMRYDTITKLESDRLVLFHGAAGTGKSYTVTNKILMLPFILQSNFKILVVRRTYDRLRSSCINLFQQQAEKLFPLNDKGECMFYKYNNQTKTAKFGANMKSSIVYRSLNNPKDYDQVKSITDVDVIWVEEATEITRDAFFGNLYPRLRGGNPLIKQCYLTFNPTSKTNWIFKDLFERDIVPHRKIYVNAFDSSFLQPDYIAQLKANEKYNTIAYKAYYLGEWQDQEGSLFRKEDLSFYNFQNLPYYNEPIKAYCDLGFTGDKTVMIVGRQKFDDGLIYITHVFRFTGTPDEVLEKIAKKCVDYNIEALGIEANFRQNDDVNKIEKVLREKNFKGSIKKIYNKIPKEKRIVLAQPIIKEYVRFRKDYEEIDDYRDFMNQVIAYGNWDEMIRKKERHDDDPDALEGFVSNMCDRYGVPMKSIQFNKEDYFRKLRNNGSVKTEIF